MHQEKAKFINACRIGSLTLIKKRITKNLDEHTWKTAAGHACINNNLKIVKLLINGCKRTESVFFDYACKNGNTKFFKYVVPLSQWNFAYSLRFACRNHHKKIIIISIENGADLTDIHLTKMLKKSDYSYMAEIGYPIFRVRKKNVRRNILIKDLSKELSQYVNYKKRLIY